jgi:hypothetical protein
MRLIARPHLGRVAEPSPAPDTAATRVPPAWPVSGGTGPTPPTSVRSLHGKGRSTTAREGAPPRMPPLRKPAPRSHKSRPSRHVPEPPLGLSEVTWQRIGADPRVARLVRPVWSRLAELELAGHDPGALAALRYTLVLHQPTRRGTCRACRWRGWPVRWWRRRWPCATWIQIRTELLGDGRAKP